MKLLENKNAVITGGSSGIGFAIAEKLVKNGANVLLIARSEEKLLKAQQSLSEYASQVQILPADLSDTSQLTTIKSTVLEKLPTIDILVNNAGIARFVPFEEMNETLLDLHLDLNVKAMYLLTQALFPYIKKQKGNILNISSYFSHRMLNGRTTTAYSLSKGAVDSFTKSLAFEVGKYGVRVNAIAPGSVATELFEHNYQQLSEEGKSNFDTMVQTIYPLGRIGQPMDIAEMALFLVSDKAQWIKGSIFAVDGGLTTN